MKASTHKQAVKYCLGCKTEIEVVGDSSVAEVRVNGRIVDDCPNCGENLARPFRKYFRDQQTEEDLYFYLPAESGCPYCGASNLHFRVDAPNGWRVYKFTVYCDEGCNRTWRMPADRVLTGRLTARDIELIAPPPFYPDIDNDPIAIKWNYYSHAVRRYKGHLEPATEKQLRYIRQLASRNPATGEDMLYIMRMEYGQGATFDRCTKGQAGFIIRCFLDSESDESK